MNKPTLLVKKIKSQKGIQVKTPLAVTPYEVTRTPFTLSVNSNNSFVISAHAIFFNPMRFQGVVADSVFWRFYYYRRLPIFNIFFNLQFIGQ